MRHSVVAWCLAGVACVAASSAAGGLKPTPTKAEMALAREWVAKSFTPAKNGQAPFSFVYDGKRSDTLLPEWGFSETTSKLDRSRIQRVQVYTDPATGLQIRVVLVHYKNFPTVEWTAYLKNSGTKDTPILEDLNALDIEIRRGNDTDEFVLRHNRGTPGTPRDYEPFVTRLGPGAEKRITGDCGRPTSSDLCYFNLKYGRQGMIIALGWPGQIATSFTRDSGDSIRIVSGQELTHFRLFPGEEVRTPLVAIQFWQDQPASIPSPQASLSGGMPSDDIVRSQNIWRRWMIAYNLPRPDGKPMPNVYSTSVMGLFPGMIGNQKEILAVLNTWGKRAPHVDCLWVDAGWYTCGNDWVNTGTWEPDPVRFPGGLRSVSDVAHAGNMKLMVWFEPERVAPGSWLANNHPEWLLASLDDTANTPQLGKIPNKILDLGNPEALKWLTDYVDKFLVDQRIDIYRQDFNIDPLAYWRFSDAQDRQGITEMKYIQGLLAYWAELKKRHPDMPFDECASGGRRNDLEMMRLGFPITKTDFGGGTSSTQCQTYGISSWLPYFGGGTVAIDDPYAYRSNFAPWSATRVDTRDESKDLSGLYKVVAEGRKVMPYFSGDFCPLTPYTLDENVWMAWQFNLPERGIGIVQAFRRPENTQESMTFKLHSLDPKSTYELTDFDSPDVRKMAGEELMKRGLTITTKQKPWASIITYRRVANGT